MKSSQKGFAPLILLLIVAGVLVAGGAGYWYYQSQNKAPELIGGQKDEHGCLGPAGYSWCEAKQKCLRVWEEKCESTSTTQAVATSSIIVSNRDHSYFNTFLIDGVKAVKTDKESIQKDFGMTRNGDILVDFIYENQQRIYFTPPNSVGEGRCMDLAYLDKASLLYYATSLYGCSVVPFEKTKPYYIENLYSWDFSKNPSLYAVNLDTGEIAEIYKPSENESLFAGYTGEWSTPYMRVDSVDSTKVKVGIYKRYKSITEMPKDQDDDYFSEKIRDEIILLPTM